MRSEPLYPKVVRHVSAWALTLSLVMAGLVVLCAGCRVPPEAAWLIEDGVAYNEGNLNDETLGDDAKTVSLQNQDLLHKIRFTLDGTPLPEGVAARKRAREAAATERSQ